MFLCYFVARPAVGDFQALQEALNLGFGGGKPTKVDSRWGFKAYMMP